MKTALIIAALSALVGHLRGKAIYPTTTYRFTTNDGLIELRFADNRRRVITISTNDLE